MIHTATRVGESPAAVVDLNERNWLPRHARGDGKAFNEFLNAYRTLVLTLLFRYGVEAQHRDDLFQDVFLKVHQAAASYRPSEPLRPWLVSIVLNTVRNHRRGVGRQQRFIKQLKVVSSSDTGSRKPATATTTTTAPIETMDRNPAPDEQLEQQAKVAWLEHQIAQLPESQRKVLVLSTIKGLSMKEVASVLTLPENTVKTHLRRARLALAESLVQREAAQHSATATGGEYS